MHNYQSFRELKASALESLSGNYTKAISVFLNIEIMSLLPSYLIVLLFPGNTVFQIIGAELVSFIISVFIRLLDFGSCLFYLKLACRQPASVSDIFYGFKTNRNAAVTIGLIFTLIATLCMLPFSITSYSAAIPADITSMSILFLLLFGGYLAATFLMLPIQQSFYILLDFPNYTAKQALRFSMQLMKGNYFRYLGFLLSFLPLFFLSWFTCGIGLLWVIPYMHASQTAFYLDLIKNHPKQ